MRNSQSQAKKAEVERRNKVVRIPEEEERIWQLIAKR